MMRIFLLLLGCVVIASAPSAVPAADLDFLHREHFTSHFPAGENEINQLVFSRPNASLRTTDRWFAADKADHFLVSAMLASSGFLSLKVTRNDEDFSFVSSVGLTFGLGVLKEIYDWSHPDHQASWRDLTADLLGAVLGTWIARSL